MLLFLFNNTGNAQVYEIDAPVLDTLIAADKDIPVDENGVAEVDTNYFLPKPAVATGSQAGTYQKRTSKKEDIQKWKADPEFYYADKSFQKSKDEYVQKNKRSGRFWNLYNFLTLLAVMVFGAIIVLFISSQHGGLFRKANTILRNEDEQEMPTDIFAINYDKEIALSEKKADYRMAVRLHFLKLLKNMANIQVINYQEKRTNLDYHMQLYGTAWHDDFGLLSRHFEYSWYGQFEVSEPQYEKIKSDFLKVEQRF